jgi:hypothetical protein
MYFRPQNVSQIKHFIARFPWLLTEIKQILISGGSAGYPGSSTQAHYGAQAVTFERVTDGLALGQVSPRARQLLNLCFVAICHAGWIK